MKNAASLDPIARRRPLPAPAHRRLVSSPLIALLLIACQGAAPEGEGVPPGAERPDGETPMPATESDSLRLRLELPDEVRAGEPVPITLRLENISDRPIELHLTGRTIAFDIIVSDTDGRVTWRRLEGAVVPAILQLRTLGSGERLELEDTWDQRSNAGEPVEAGDYRVRGEVPTDGEPLVTPGERLRIAPD